MPNVPMIASWSQILINCFNVFLTWFTITSGILWAFVFAYFFVTRVDDWRESRTNRKKRDYLLDYEARVKR